MVFYINYVWGVFGVDIGCLSVFVCDFSWGGMANALMLRLA